MPTYTVHAPPLRKGEASAPERFRFARDGFHFWAFLLAPLWLLVHRLWLALTIYVVAYGLVTVGLIGLRASTTVHLLAGFVIALLMGFEASSIRRWTYSRRGWRTLGFVVGEDEEIAERRFFAEWTKGAAPPPAEPKPFSASPSETPPAMPARRGSSTGGEVIGLFPEPGASR